MACLNDYNYYNCKQLLIHTIIAIIADRIRRMGEGNVFSLFTGGRGYSKVPTPLPRYLPPVQIRTGWREGVPQGTYPRPRHLLSTKVPTPCPGQGGGRGVQGTYPPSSSGWGRGYPKVPTPVQVKTGGEGVLQGTYPPPRFLHPIPVCLLRSCRRTFLFITVFII